MKILFICLTHKVFLLFKKLAATLKKNKNDKCLFYVEILNE